MQCRNCNIDTNNPSFCSRSCAQTFNNQRNPKRKLTKECSVCSKKIFSNKKFCSDCSEYGKAHNRTLGYYKEGNANNFGAPYVRALSRKEYINSGRPLSCYVCGYDYHVDVCHIRDIKDFPLDTLLSEINHIDNLVALCKNHHYEFDHGHLSL